VYQNFWFAFALFPSQSHTWSLLPSAMRCQHRTEELALVHVLVVEPLVTSRHLPPKILICWFENVHSWLLLEA
jgi:hypothetical protein